MECRIDEWKKGRKDKWKEDYIDGRKEGRQGG